MKISEIRPNTFVIDFETREDLMSTFLRFQEYYESPEFKHKIFHLPEFEEWYRKSRNSDTFSYYSDWSGCNVPSYVFDFFRTGSMNPLSEKEQKLLELLPTQGRFYVIGVFNGGDEGTIEHEVCHSLFYSSEQYKKDATEIVYKYWNELEEMRSYIINLGYHPDVLIDELQAYIAANSEHLIEDGVYFPEEMHLELASLVKRYDK